MSVLAIERPSFLEALHTRARVTVAVMTQQIKRHGGGARLSFPLSMLDMSGRIMVLALVFSLIGRRPAFGDSVVLFLVTGIIPFLFFLRATNAVRRQELFGSNDPTPLTTTATHALANVLTFMIITFAAAIVVCTSMHLFGIRYAIPSRPLYPIAAVLLFGLMAFGFGLFNAMFCAIFPPWASFWRIATRGLFLLSGIFYVTDFLPYQVREILIWNPLVHGVILSRMGFFENHPTLVVDPHYLLMWGMTLTLFGLGLHRIFRRRFR